MANKKDIRDYTDPRAMKFIDNNFVGKNHGNNGRDNEMSSRFNTAHEDARPTETVKYRHAHYCVYCSEGAVPIQAGLVKYGGGALGRGTPNHAYETTGHQCVCKGAMDEMHLDEVLKMLEDEKAKYMSKMEHRMDKLKSKHFKNNPPKASGVVTMIMNRLSKTKSIDEVGEILAALETL